MVACRSLICTGFSAALKPKSSVAPKVVPPFMPAPASSTREAVRVVVAAILNLDGRAVLYRGRPAELAAHDDQSLLKQPERLQILDERGNGPIGLARQLAVYQDVIVIVPGL